jgi:adenosylcobinamide-GDP ribazoletransferase
MALAVVAFPYARPEGLGRMLKDNAGWRQLVLATATAGALAICVGAWLGLIALTVVATVAVAGAVFALRRLGGLTGDIYGALCEVAEVATLLVFVAGETP